jgi:formiminotetrahydrofolate cyclodeaminase
MPESLEQVLEQAARRGSWVGGGSMAALSAAAAAALAEKLSLNARLSRQLRTMRRECLRLMRQDAASFARVISATRRPDRQAFRAALQRATDIPCQVAERAGTIQTACRRLQGALTPRLRPDLVCARALAQAAHAAACALIETNLAWLRDRVYSRMIRRRLWASADHHARVRR